MPTYLNANVDGLLKEVYAGLLDKDNAEDCIKKKPKKKQVIK